MKNKQTLCQFLGIKFEGGNPFIITHNGKEVYREYYDGCWYKREYDDKGNEIYYEDSSGYWRKYEYDSDGNETYYENSNGFWYKQKHDVKGNQIYFETANGVIKDHRLKEITMDEIAEKFGIPIEQLKIKK